MRGVIIHDGARFATTAGPALTAVFIVNRIASELYASMYGYFWLPCDLCGTYSKAHAFAHHDERTPTQR